jgi:hypothetical protein
MDIDPGHSPHAAHPIAGNTSPAACRRDAKMTPVVKRSDTTGTRRPPPCPHPGEGCQDQWETVTQRPVVALRSTTGCTLGCLWHPSSRRASHPGAPGMIPTRLRNRRGHRREHVPERHPGGMPDCSRWLSEATPPEPGSHLAIDPGRGRSPACDISPGRPCRMPFVSVALLVAIHPPAILPRCRGWSRKEHKDHKRDGCVRFATSRPRLPTASRAVPKPKCKRSRSDPIA